MKNPLFPALVFCASITPGIAAEEYVFDLKAPPEYAKEWFAIAAREVAAGEAGPSSGFVIENYRRLANELAPKPGAPPEHWAAFRYAQMRYSLSYLPNMVYLKSIRETAKDKEEVKKLMRDWADNSRANDAAEGILGLWRLGRPDLPPRTKPEEVRKLNRYTLRLAAQMWKQVNAAYDPDFEKTYAYKDTHDSSRLPGYALYRTIHGGANLKAWDEKEKERLRVAWRNEAWCAGMQSMHEYLKHAYSRFEGDLCNLFRAYAPGDKATIREVLIDAGLKTVEQRKAYWEHCRTYGAIWAGWEPADEQRLVTE